MKTDHSHPGIKEVLEFPLLAALMGRRARRFSQGADIPDGPLAFTSKEKPLPLSETEKLLLLATAAGNTGWNFLITRNARYAPHFPNYAGAAGGRTFPSAAGFHTSQLFFTDDSGTYLFDTRDAPALQDQTEPTADGLDAWLEVHRARIKQLSDKRLHLPAEEPYMEGHNTWCVNRPGSLLLIPVTDVAQHLLLGICFLVQNGWKIYNDVHREEIPGLDQYHDLLDPDKIIPLTYAEQYMLTECTAELSCSCYAGMLMLQAMGLGGWMFDGVDRHAILGASGNPDVPGLGFRYDTDERWAIPNPTGLKGVFEGHCPPHFPDMRMAVQSVVSRKFGKGGPFNANTPGPFTETSAVRGSAQVHSDRFIDCVALQAQYIFDKFGKFPGTVPTIFSLMYLQAHHLDLAFYDRHFKPGAYLDTHRQHLKQWHNGK